MVVDFEGTPLIPGATAPIPPNSNISNISTKSHVSLLSPFGLLGPSAWFGHGGDHLDSEPSEEDKAAESTFKKIIAECKIRGIFFSFTLYYIGLFFDRLRYYYWNKRFAFGLSHLSYQSSYTLLCSLQITKTCFFFGLSWFTCSILFPS